MKRKYYWVVPFVLIVVIGWKVMVDIGSLEQDSSPDSAADFVMSLKTSTGKNMKVLMDDLPSSAGLSNIVEDLTPQLGGDLDLNGKNLDFPTTVNISDVKDEDNMASDSATMLATQQSIKAYVDAKAGDVTAAANLGDNFLIRGDGATKGVQNSGITIDDSDNMSGVGTLTATVEVRTPKFTSTAADGLHQYQAVNTIDYTGSEGEGMHYYQSTSNLFLRKKSDSTFEEEVGTNTAVTLINKTIDADNNPISNIGSAEITNDSIVNVDIKSDAAIAGSKIVDATTSVEGSTEYATAAEIDIGTAADRSLPVDQYVASKRNIKHLIFTLFAPGSDTAVLASVGGDFKIAITGTIIQNDSLKDELSARNDTAGTTGTMVVDIHLNGTTIMDTNKLDIETTEKDTNTAVTQPDLSTTAISAGDILTFDVDAVHTTPGKGLKVYMAIRES